MKQRLLLTTSCAVILILVACILTWRNLSSNSDERAKQNPLPTTRKTHSTDFGLGRDSQFKPEAQADHGASALNHEGKPTAPVTKEQILETVHEASITYDPKALPAIQKYLLDADPEIREAARNGMIVLGDASAAPMLRDASKLAPTPHEAVAMLEAADYVELPSGTLNLKKRSTTRSKRPLSRPKPQGGQAPE